MKPHKYICYSIALNNNKFLQKLLRRYTGLTSPPSASSFLANANEGKAFIYLAVIPVYKHFPT